MHPDGYTISGSGHITNAAKSQMQPYNDGFIAEATASDSDVTVHVAYPSEVVASAYFSGRGENPLASLSELGPIIYNCGLLIDSSSPAAPTFTLTGSHTQFPAFEIYINGQRIHHYDPIPAGKSPIDITSGPTVHFNAQGTISQ
jgi:hypothetical protein